MRVVFVSPPFNIIKEGYGSSVKKTKYGNWLPFGLAVLASCVKKEGHEVKIIDAIVNDYSNEEIIKQIKDFKADIVGISALLASKKQAVSLIKQAKKKMPEIKVFLGGPLATTFSKDMLKEVKELDFALVGETEKTLPELVNKLERNEDIKDVKGLAYRHDKEIIQNEKPEALMNLDELPHPAWELFELEKYIPLPLMYKKLPIIPYLTSRGCPYRRCAFCYESGSAAPKYRRHSPEYVVKDIKRLVEKFKVKEIAFWDDIFLVNEKWVLKFCKLLEKEKIKISWQVYGHNGMVTKKMLKACAKAGCWNVFYGIESGNQELLDSIHKGVTLEKIKESVRWTHDAGMDTRGSFVLALPKEDPEKALETIKFAIDIDLTFAQFLPLFPEYGTEIYEDAMKHGEIIKEYKGRTTAQYVPKGYKDAQEIEKMVKTAYRKFYFRPNYIFKHMKRVIIHPSLIPQYFSALGFIKGIGFKK